MLAHPYFAAGWSDPERFWSVILRWASDDESSPGAARGPPNGKLWFWETGVDMLFDRQVRQ